MNSTVLRFPILPRLERHHQDHLSFDYFEVFGFGDVSDLNVLELRRPFAQALGSLDGVSATTPLTSSVLASVSSILQPNIQAPDAK